MGTGLVSGEYTHGVKGDFFFKMGNAALLKR